MESTSQDRNLPASERKLRRAIEDGQVTRSRDLSHLAVLGAGGLALLALAPMLFERLKLDLSRQLSFDAATLAQSGSMLTRMQEVVVAGLVACTVFALMSKRKSVMMVDSLMKLFSGPRASTNGLK